MTVGSRRRHRKPDSMPPLVQRLFETCSVVFFDGRPGVVPSPEDVNRLKAVLDDLKPADVGLNPKKPEFGKTNPRGVPAITYLHLYECDKFSIGIFCLPPGDVIPLHNHPGMTVFSKLLYGSMQIRSYDWADILHNGNASDQHTNFHPPGARLAKVNTDAVFTAPCDTSILYPEDGNIHRFTARTSCAVLDVLGPPYSDHEGRHCTYYNDFSSTSVTAGDVGLVPGDVDGYAWLEERERPRDFLVVGAEYRGPRIVDH